MRGRGMKAGFFADLLERDGFFACRKDLKQGKNTLNDLDSRFSWEVVIVF